MYRKHIEYFFLALIVGAVGTGVTYIGRMSENIQQMTISVQLLAEKLTNIDKIAQDHEVRIREIERNKLKSK